MLVLQGFVWVKGNARMFGECMTEIYMPES